MPRIGWIYLERTLTDHGLWLKDPFSRGQAWVDLLMLASHKDTWFMKRGVRIEVRRGQVCWSIKGLADRWQWSRGKIRRFLNLLENEHQVVHQSTNVTTLITIVNYDQYQKKGHQVIQQTDTKRTHSKNVNKTTHTTGELSTDLSTGLSTITRTPIDQSFYPDQQTIEYCAARALPDPTDRIALDDFINTNLSSHWTSANWQAEYRKFLPKWRLRHEKSDTRSKSERSLDAIRNLPDS